MPAASAYAKMAAEGMSAEDVDMFRAAMGEAVTVGQIYGPQSFWGLTVPAACAAEDVDMFM